MREDTMTTETPRRRSADSFLGQLVDAAAKVGVPAVLAGAMLWFSAVEVRGMRAAFDKTTEKLGQLIEVLKVREVNR